ncbi:sorting nexin mvp-1 [Apiospora marii]|uniref:Sorting nexin mvp-1 n=1 Tax=Apiospora marii TaxID=335849 RepID=A0ABR1R451_9PEZI
MPPSWPRSLHKPPELPKKDSPPRSQARKPSMSDPEDDPWNTPDLHRNHHHAEAPSASNGNRDEPRVSSFGGNGYGPGDERDVQRTTSTFTTPSIGSETPIPSGRQSAASGAMPSNPGDWGYFDGSNPAADAGFGGAPSNQAISPFGGASSADRTPNMNPPAVSHTRTISAGRTGSSVEENIVVTLMPEKEGLFMFQHHNYEVTSSLEELSVWRKQATISVQDEFTGRPLPPGLEDSLPIGPLNELFDRTRSGVRRSAELYINACNLMDRLVKRSEGVAADHARMAVSLGSLTEASNDTYATDTNDVPLLNDGLVAMSKDLKRQRDSLVSVRDMFERRERLDKDNIPYLERRIQTNETKLAGLRAKPDGLVKPGEIERVVENIIKDKENIVNQHNRSVFVRECIRDELIYFQQTQYHVSRLAQDWAQERVKYGEMLADNWRRLLDELDGMPLGD